MRLTQNFGLTEFSSIESKLKPDNAQLQKVPSSYWITKVILVIAFSPEGINCLLDSPALVL